MPFSQSPSGEGSTVQGIPSGVVVVVFVVKKSLPLHIIVVVVISSNGQGRHKKKKKLDIKSASTAVLKSRVHALLFDKNRVSLNLDSQGHAPQS